MNQSTERASGPTDVIKRTILRWLISALAIFAAIYVVPGINFHGPGWEVGLVAITFGLVNALLRPILTLLTCPLVILTLGLFTLVINGLLLLATAAVAGWMGIDFTVDGFWPAFLGGLVISIVSGVLGWLAGDTQVEVRARRVE